MTAVLVVSDGLTSPAGGREPLESPGVGRPPRDRRDLAVMPGCVLGRAHPAHRARWGSSEDRGMWRSEDEDPRSQNADQLVSPVAQTGFLRLGPMRLRH